MPKTRRAKMVVTKSLAPSTLSSSASGQSADSSSSSASTPGNSSSGSGSNATPHPISGASNTSASTSASTSTPTSGSNSNSNSNSNSHTPSRNKSKRRQNRKNGTASSSSSKTTPSSNTSSLSFQPFQIAPEYEWTATTTQDGKTVFGPPPPPPSSSSSSTNTMTATSYTTAKGVPYSVISNRVSTSDVKGSNSNSGNNGGGGGSGGGPSSSSSTSTTTVNSVAASMAAAAAFGNIDLINMAQSEMINFGVSATTMMAASASASSSTAPSSSNNKNNKNKMKKNDSSKGSHGGNSNSSKNIGGSKTTMTINATGRKSSDYKSVAFHQAKDVLQKYVEGVSAASKKGNNNSSSNTGGSGSSSGGGNSSNKNDNNTSRSSKDGNNNSSSSSNNASANSSGDAGPGITTQPCSDADMKALMSMFVEIMGMSSNLDSNGKENNNKSSSSNNSGGNNSGSGSSNVDTAAVNAARASLSEHITRIHMQNAAMAMTGGAPNNTSSNSSSKGSNSSKSSSNSNPFPVVSMMFGGGGGGNNNNNSKNKNMPNVIPPPPGGWPPGAAAAAAAALAAASNGAASVTVPLGNGSISLPLGMAHISSHRHHEFTIPTGSGDRVPPEWMRDACKFMNDNNDYDDSSDISAVNGSDDDNDDDNDESSSRNRKSSHGKNSVKPAPQDQTSGAALCKNQRKRGNSDTSASTSNDKVDIDTSDAAAAELLREEEETVLKLQEEEEKARRAAKKKEKKNRKKEKAKREAAIKAAQAAQKKREKTITSWRSRVASACSGGEVHKIDALISDNPFKDAKQHQIDPDILEELGGDSLSFEEEVTQNMEWLLPSCVAKFRDAKPKEIESRSKLAIFVMRMAFHVIFIPRRDGRSAFHTACVVGDLSFAKLVAEKAMNYNEKTKYLDILCEDLGWSPLHYAAAGGWNDVVEVLLASGCKIRIRTDPARTCLISNEHGVSTKQLLEFIHAGNHATNLEFNSDGLQEIIDSRTSESAAERTKYKKAIETLITRVNDVENNGYSPIEIKLDPADEKNYNQDIQGKSKKQSTEESKTKKKKKKKKKSQTVTDFAEDSSVAASISSIPIREPDIDLVSMLLAMGFTEDQIDAAADACGGTDRATADDLIEWILGGGASDNNNQSDEASGSTRENSSLNRDSSIEGNASRVLGIEQKQKRAEMQAKKEAEEAAKREAEVKAAAERLAAKREEQRRIRREWNNREQMRQQEEAESRLAEEVERKRRIEIERAKVAAQRAAKERAAANAALMYQDPNATMQPMIHGNNNAPVTTNTNVGATPLFPGTSTSTTFPGGSSQNLPTDNQYYPDMHTPNHAFGQPNMQQATSRSYPQATPTYRSTPISGIDSVNAVLTPDRSSGRTKPKKASPVNLEVNGYEFPVLGATKLSSPPRRQRSKNKDSPSSGDNRKVSRSKTRKKKNESPSKGKPTVEPPSPITHIVPSQNMDDQNTSVSTESYQSNPLGEIRATAKAFVPTHFTPSASPQPPPGLVGTQTTGPPGLVPAATSNPLLPKNLPTGSSLLSSSTSSMLPGNSAPVSSILSNNSSSILPSTSVPFDGSTSHGISQHYNANLTEKHTNNNHVSIGSPEPSTNSSIVGLKAEDSVPLSFGSTPIKKSNDDLLSSNVLGGLPASSIVGSSLGILESNAATPSLSGSSIWGGAAAPVIPSNLGGFSFNFGDNAGITNSEDDAQKKENNSSSMWGAGGVSSMNGGGGSIW